ncbi:MAG: hypothetical protein GY864_08270 [Desulfobacterales bacterium]|nr:hypothetical protein [Desulfobacterales bacterium]
MTIKEVKKVLFVGAGTMGTFNSLISAMAGYDVVLFDISKEALEKAPERHKGWGEVLLEMGVCDEKALEAGLARMSLVSDPVEAARDVDLLSESVFETLELKRQTHQKFDELLPPHAIMTTNTSTLLLSDIESAVNRGDKFAAMHFHQPTTLVDIVAGPRTSPETIDIVKRFVLSQGQVYVLLKKEKEGYLHNAMFVELLQTGMMLAILLNTDFREVDRAWMINQNSEVGPFGLMDHVGLNVITDIINDPSRKDDSVNPDITTVVANFFQPYIDRGDLGTKTGKGFYSYPEPDYQTPEFLAGQEENRDLSAPLINAVLSTALTLVMEGYADIEDVDKSWMLTHNPECGPFGTIDAVGLDVVKKDLEERAAQLEDILGNPGTIIETTKVATKFLDSYIERGELGVKTGKGFYQYPDPAFKKQGFLETDDVTLFGRAHS